MRILPLYIAVPTWRGMARRPPRSAAMRLFLVILGFALVVASPIIGVLPGPGGIFVLAGGLVLVLQNSRFARRVYARMRRRRPRIRHMMDMALRRRSAVRRAQRARAEAGLEPRTGLRAWLSMVVDGVFGIRRRKDSPRDDAHVTTHATLSGEDKARPETESLR